MAKGTGKVKQNVATTGRAPAAKGPVGRHSMDVRATAGAGGATAKPGSAHSTVGEDRGALMNPPPGTQQLVDALKTNVQLALQIANATLDGAERMRKIQLAAARSAHAKTSALQETVSGIGRADELWNAEQHILLDNVKQAVQYWNEMLEAAAQTNASIAKILGSGFADYSHRGNDVAREMEKALGSLQAGTAMQPEWMPAVSAANAAYRQLWDNAGRMLEQMQGNLQALGSAAAKAQVPGRARKGVD